MKLRTFLGFALIFGALIFTSCKKDKNEDVPKDEGDVWSKNSVQDNKTAIENEGLKLMDEMAGMENEPAMQTNETFSVFLETANPFEGSDNFKNINLRKDYFFRVNNALTDFSDNKSDELYKSITIKNFSEPETVLEAYSLLIGIYSWNATTQSWDYTKTGSVIKFEFPSTENGSSNDASYIISFEPYVGAVYAPELVGNMPKSASAELKVGTELQMGYYIDVEYEETGIPSKIETSLVIGSYKMEVLIDHTASTAFDASYSFTHNNNILLKFTLGAGGNWSDENIEANTRYYYAYYDYEQWEWVETEVTSEEYYNEIEVDLWKVVTNGNASFQIMDVLMDGAVDLEGLGDTMENMSDELTDEEENQAEIDAFNEYVNLTLRFASSNEIIAMVEAYPVSKEKDVYVDGYWDEVNNEWVDEYETRTFYDVDFRFVFADGSKVDFETYFSTGFENIIDELFTSVEEFDNSDF